MLSRPAIAERFVTPGSQLHLTKRSTSRPFARQKSHAQARPERTNMKRANLNQTQIEGVCPKLPSIRTTLSTTPMPSIQSIKSIPTEKSLASELALGNQQHRRDSDVIPCEPNPSSGGSHPSSSEFQVIPTDSKLTFRFRDLSRSFVAIHCPLPLIPQSAVELCGSNLATQPLPKNPDAGPCGSMRVRSGLIRAQSGLIRVEHGLIRVHRGPDPIQSESNGSQAPPSKTRIAFSSRHSTFAAHS
jgi:hypothetical protein